MNLSKTTVARAVRRFFAADGGTAMVEFALVGALFSVILLGIIEFALASWQKNSAGSDAREGARYAVVHGANSIRIATQDSVANYVKGKTSLDVAGLRVNAQWPDGGSKAPGKRVKVSVAHSVPRRGPFIRAHTDSATSTMVIYY